MNKKNLFVALLALVGLTPTLLTPHGYTSL